MNVISLAAGVIGGLIGVVGTAYTIRGWRRSEQDRKVLKYLFDTAERNLRKDITEEDIQKKKLEASSIAAEINELQRHLRESIPLEARRAVLRDKLFSQEQLISQTYSEVQTLRKELGANATPSAIPPELAHVIEHEISPEYVRREERSHLKNQLTILTTGAAILSAVLPEPFGTLISIPLFLLAAPVVLRLYRSYLPKDSLGRKLYVYRIAYVGCFLGVVGTLLYPASLALRGIPTHRMGVQLSVALVVSIGFLLFGLFFMIRRRYLSRIAIRRNDLPPAVA